MWNRIKYLSEMSYISIIKCYIKLVVYKTCNCDYQSKSGAFGERWLSERVQSLSVIPSCKENRLIRFSVIQGGRSGNCDNHFGSALWRFRWEWQQRSNKRLAKLQLMTTLHIILKLIHYTQWKEPCNTNRKATVSADF